MLFLTDANKKDRHSAHVPLNSVYNLMKHYIDTEF